MRLTTLSLALLPAVAVLTGCTETNITAPRTAAGAGTIVFSSNRADGNFEIWSMAGDGSGLRRLTRDVDHNDYAPALSHDGTRIAWERDVETAGHNVVAKEIWVMNADGSDPHAVVANGSFNESPCWGPGDRSLIYASLATGNWEIFRVPLGGGAPVNLTNSAQADQYPRLSPDGTRIAFQTNRDLNFEIYAMDVDGGHQTDLTNDPADDRFPAWSPDGSRLVFTRFGDSFDIWTMDASGGGQHAVVASPFQELDPSVSPDGRSVVFESDRGAPSSLFTVPLEGGAARQLTGRPGTATGTDQQPWWGGGSSGGAGSARASGP